MMLSFAEVLALLEEDRSLLELLHAEGLLPAPIDRTYSPEEAEEVRVARVLLRELEVNVAGIEVILHMRHQILDLRQQMVDVLGQIQDGRRSG